MSNEEIKTDLHEAMVEDDQTKKQAKEIIENNRGEIDDIVKAKVEAIMNKITPPHIKGEGIKKKLARRKKQKAARKQRKANRNGKSKR
jgi:hypothetical protein